jgi:hypothetical protein
MPSVWFWLLVHNAAPPSLHGVREGPFPRFDTTMRHSDSRPSISPHFVAFAWRYHPCALFAPSGRDARPWAPGSWYSGSRAGDVSGDGRGSQVSGDPSCAYALFFDPGGIGHARPLRRADAVPAADKSEDSHDDLSRLNRTAWTLAVYASQGGLPLHHARLASGCRPALPGGIR